MSCLCLGVLISVRMCVCADRGHAPYLCEASLKGWEFALQTGFDHFFLSVLFYEQ